MQLASMYILGHSLLIFSFLSEISPPAVRAGGPLPLYIIPKVRLTLEILHGPTRARACLAMHSEVYPIVVGSKVSTHAQ